MSREAYWLEALNCALDTAGAFEELTEAQREFVARELSLAAEMEAEATGALCIPNPADTQRKREEELRKRAMKEADEREALLKKAITSHYNFPVWVSVRDGRVEVEAQR